MEAVTTILDNVVVVMVDVDEEKCKWLSALAVLCVPPPIVPLHHRGIYRQPPDDSTDVPAIELWPMRELFVILY